MNQGAGAEDAMVPGKQVGLREEGGGRGCLCRIAGRLQAEPRMQRSSDCETNTAKPSEQGHLWKSGV